MSHQFLRYGAVGAAATVAHYALLVAAVELGSWPAWIASGAGAMLGAQVAYFGNHRFTFTRHTRHRDAWPRFLATAAAGGLWGMAVVALGVRWGLHYVPAQVLATTTALVLTYGINRRWTFR